MWKEKDVNADTEETGIKGCRKRGVYPWVSVFPGPVNQSSALLSLQLHLANEKHCCATLTVTPLRAKQRDRGGGGHNFAEDEHKSRTINHRTCMLFSNRFTCDQTCRITTVTSITMEVPFTARLASYGQHLQPRPVKSISRI